MSREASDLEHYVREAYAIRDKRESDLLYTIKREGRIRMVLEAIIILAIAATLYWFGFRASTENQQQLQDSNCTIEKIVREQTISFGGTPPPISPECR